MNTLGISEQTEIVLQPYGSFVVNRERNRFDVLNSKGTATLLSFVRPGSIEDAAIWGEVRGIPRDSLVHLVSALEASGYLGVPASSPRFSFLEEREVLKATRVEIEITNRCNLRCVYCYAEVNKSRTELSGTQWIRILDGMYRHGLRAILVSGGEPFMHPDVMDVLSWAAPRLIVEINSNGRYITPLIAEKLASLDIKSVQISLDSVESEHHDSLRGKGSHARAVNAIKVLVDAGVPTQASAVVTSSNRDTMDELRSFVVGLGAGFKGDPVTRTGYAREIPDSNWADSFAASSSDRFPSFEREGGLGFDPLCQSQVGYVAVSHQGVLKPCNMREGFFEPTGGVLMSTNGEEWWDDFYGRTGLAQLALAAKGVGSEEAFNLKEPHTGYLCELQLSVLNAGQRGVLVPLGRSRLDRP
jgi:uncharacterized Fe-S cluster-containing radical SAM superfamily protein